MGAGLPLGLEAHVAVAADRHAGRLVVVAEESGRALGRIFEAWLLHFDDDRLRVGTREQYQGEKGKDEQAQRSRKPLLQHDKPPACRARLDTASTLGASGGGGDHATIRTLLLR